MAAEGNPQHDDARGPRGLTGLTWLATAHPRVTLLVALAVAAASVLLASRRLDHRPGRLLPISDTSPVHQRWLAFRNQFGDKDDVLAVVEGPDRREISRAVKELAGQLAGDPLFQDVVHSELELPRLRAKGLHYLPDAELRRIEALVHQAEALAESGWSLFSPPAVRAAAEVAADRKGDLPPQALAEAWQRLDDLTSLMLAALEQPGAYRSPLPPLRDGSALLAALQAERLPGDPTGLVTLRLAGDGGADSTRDEAAIDRLRQIVSGVKSRHRGLEIGLTGIPVIEHDQARRRPSPLGPAAVLSLGGILLALVAGLGGLRHALCILIAATLGAAWSFGYAALAVSHWNTLSAAAASILIGLGISYGVSYAAAYLRLRRAGRGTREALLGTAASVGPAVTTAAAIAALAFFMAGMSGLADAAELGLAAGGGLLLCWLAAVTVLPALVRVWDARRLPQHLPAPLDFRRALEGLARRPRLVLAVCLAATLLVAVAARRLSYDYDLLRLPPSGLESVALQQKLLRQGGAGGWFAVSIADSPEDLLVRKQRFQRLPSVRRIEEVVSLVPAGSESNRAAIGRIAARLKRLPAAAPQGPVAPPAQVLELVAEVLSLPRNAPQAVGLVRRLDALAHAVAGMPEAEYYRRVAAFQQRLAEDVLARIRSIAAAADPRPPVLTDLPEGLARRFVGRSGRHLLRLYGEGDVGDADAMRQFAREVRAVDPAATGLPLEVHQAVGQLRHNGLRAAALAAGGIALVTLVHFASLRLTLLALAPLTLGMLQTAGLMGLLGIPLDPVNVAGLPLVLGLGMGGGLLVVHDFAAQRGRYRMSPATALSVVLGALAALAGLAPLNLADHGGLQGLGRVLTLGLGCCLLSTIVVLPCLLSWLTRRLAADDDDQVGRPGQAIRRREVPPIYAPAVAADFLNHRAA